jgi:hypothetical protein
MGLRTAASLAITHGQWHKRDLDTTQPHQRSFGANVLVLSYSTNVTGMCFSRDRCTMVVPSLAHLTIVVCELNAKQEVLRKVWEDAKRSALILSCVRGTCSRA